MRSSVATFLLLLTAGGLYGQQMRQGTDALSALAFADARLRPASVNDPLEAAPASLAAAVRADWASFQAASSVHWEAYVDRRTGRIESAVGGGIPWVPGPGNALNRAQAGKPVDLADLEGVARKFLPRVAPMLGVDPASLVLNSGRSGKQAGHLWYVDFDVRRGGLAVEGARVVFRVSHGNLIEIGAENLPSPGTVTPAMQIDRGQALAALSTFVGGFSAADVFVDGGSLHLLPANADNPRYAEGFEPGNGRGLALIWEVVFRRRGVTGTWRARVDAVTGEVVELLDTNEYGGVTGGAFPLSPTTTPEAVLPMPFADVPPSGFADSAGFFSGFGPVTSKLNGKYVKIADSCGPISLTANWPGDLAFGLSAGTDCVTPGTGGNGNTHAARTQFYHVNRIKEVGRAWLPANSWLQQQLSVNVNLNQTCNAYWNGTTLNFFKSGGGCNNTGEISSVALHEYGHGLDQNDGNGSSPENGTGETYGDFTAALATHNSCIGPGFRAVNCGGYGNACTSCTGVRDIDWAQHVLNTPATVNNFTQTCPNKPSYVGPCGKEGHCESYVSSEALWDFVGRDLPNPGSAAAWAVVERLWYLSRATATNAFTCSTAALPWTSSGCATGSLWRTLRAADDDDGDLTNGTPHSCQLFAAFDRHGLACASDPGANVCFSGCTPPAVPSLTLTPGDGQVQVSWSSSGAGILYDLYRSELGCNGGFVRVADSTAGTSYLDTSVSGGLSYSYQVVAHPSGGTACAAAPTSCQSATPTAPVCSTPTAPAGVSAGAAGVSHVNVSWTPVGGVSGYNVYRATSAGGPYTLRATVTAPSFADGALAGGTAYFYKVRSFASACESADSNTATAATNACTRVSVYKSDFETGSGLGGWSTLVLPGGAATNDWRGIQACSPTKSGSKIFRFGGASCTAQYGINEATVAAPPALPIPASAGNTQLSFWHRRGFETSFDGGRVTAALDGGSTYYFGPDSALSGETYDNTIAGPGAGTCAPGSLGGTTVFSGAKSTMVNTTVNLDAICDSATLGTDGCSGHSVRPGFLSISDCTQGGTGWFLDDVEVTACLDPASPLDLYTITPCRLIDTRSPAGPLGGPSLGAGAERTFMVTGTCGIPVSARALAINITAVAPGAGGYLQVVPGGTGASTSSSINFIAGTTRANNGVVPLATDWSGNLLVRSGTSVPVDFVIDVTGYFQ